MSELVAVVTIVHGRHGHLLGQRWGLARQTRPVDLHVIVAMDDPEIRTVLEDSPGGPDVLVVDVPVVAGRLPLAAARNAGVAAARETGAEVVILLDVDCVPAPDLVSDYLAALTHRSPADGEVPVVACGVVRYLDAPTSALPHPDWSYPLLDDGSARHPARPAPAQGAIRLGRDPKLFWALSFALATHDWERVGGFDEAYVGYGAEDTDFGQRLVSRGGCLLWLGGATAYHQHHGGGGLPVHHVGDIVENAARFAARWGWWPMQGWLDAFEDLGLVERDGSRGFVLARRPWRSDGVSS